MFTLPPAGFGPGSQPAPEDGAELNYMAMPSGMRTFEARLPEIADPAAAAPVLAFLDRLADAAEATASGGIASVPTDSLDAAGRQLLADTLGEGEVSVLVEGHRLARIQEAVYAGLWRVREHGRETIEIGAAPSVLRDGAHEAFRPAHGLSVSAGPGVMSAPALVAELLEKGRDHRDGDTAHVINLTLLPHTPQDLAHLDAALGQGAAVVLSRGYGNCRVEATAVPKVWRVRFFNSMDQLILDTIEVTAIPDVVLAAPEDLRDSAARLREAVAALS
jgi:hydrogenase-1 operon protein HyaF